MDDFEKLCEDLEVHTGVINSALDIATTSMTPEDQVTEMLQEVEHPTLIQREVYCFVGGCRAQYGSFGADEQGYFQCLC